MADRCFCFSDGEFRNILAGVQLSSYSFWSGVQRVIQQLPGFPLASRLSEDSHDDVRGTWIRGYILQQLHQLSNTVSPDGSWDFLGICIARYCNIDESAGWFGSKWYSGKHTFYVANLLKLVCYMGEPWDILCLSANWHKCRAMMEIPKSLFSTFKTLLRIRIWVHFIHGE